MRRHNLAEFVLSLITVVSVTPIVHATPSDYKVLYSIHEVRDDPESAVVYRLQLDLEYVSTVGNQVRWDVTTMVISHFDSQGTIDEQWRLNDPVVSTGDGKWWTTHADPNNPAIGEFVTPPPMTGTAEREIGSGPDLDYDLSAGTASGSPPYAATAYMNLWLRRIGEPEPDVDDEDEPQQTEDGAL